MSDYTPTTSWLRIIVGYAMTRATDRTKPVEEARAEGYERFDRWLAAHDRKVAVQSDCMTIEEHASLCGEVEALNEQLAAAQAVIAQMRNWAEDSVDARYGTLNASYVNNLLAQSPTDALQAHDREVAAKAWGEGWNTGWDGRMLHDAGIEGHADAPNPHISDLVSEPSTPDPVEPERPTCSDFHWVGQAFSSCDMCGEPFWDHVTHRGEPISDEFRAGVKRKREVVEPVPEPTTDTKGTP